MNYPIHKISAINRETTDNRDPGLLVLFEVEDNKAMAIQTWREGIYPKVEWSIPIYFTNEESYIEFQTNFMEDDVIAIYIQREKFLNQKNKIKNKKENKEVIII